MMVPFCECRVTGTKSQYLGYTPRFLGQLLGNWSYLV